MQGLGAVDALGAGAAEQDERQLRRGQGVGAGVVAIFDIQVEVLDPVIQTGLAALMLRAEHGRQGCHVHKGMLQAVTQAVFERTGEHVLVERGVKGQQRAVTDKRHKVQQGVGRVAAGGNCTGPQAMQQDAGAQRVVGAQQGPFKGLAEVDGAVFNDHRANR